MPLANYSSSIARVDTEGKLEAVGGATVEVRSSGTGNLANLFDDREGLSPKSNPFQSDSTGAFAFYVSGGAYRIEVSDSSGNDIVLDHQAIGTAGEHDAGPESDEINVNNEYGIDENDIVGTDIPGAVGRGAIVEQGVNENGYFVKWESGLMMTRTRFDMEQDGSSTDRLIAPNNVQLPATFADTASMFPIMNVPIHSATAFINLGRANMRCFGPAQLGGSAVFTTSEIGASLWADSGSVDENSKVEGAIMIVFGNWK